MYAVVPPKTEYRLTDEGRELHEPVAVLCDWASGHKAFLGTVHDRLRDVEAPETGTTQK